MDRLDRVEKMLVELAKSHKEWEKDFKKRNEEWERKFQKEKEEWEKNFQKNKEEWEKNFQKEKKEWEKNFQKLKDETWKSIKEGSQNLGGIGRSIGMIPEGLAEPQILEWFKKFGLNPITYLPNAKGLYRGKEKELDLIIIGKLNGKVCAIDVEIQVQYKSTKEIDAVIEFLEKDFRNYFQVFANAQLIGSVCGMKFGKGIVEYAMKQGLLVMKPVKGIMGIINPVDFKYRVM